MPTLRHTNPLGQMDVPLVRREGEPFGTHGSGCLEPGEEFEVTQEQADLLLEQAENYELVQSTESASTPEDSE